MKYFILLLFTSILSFQLSFAWNLNSEWLDSDVAIRNEKAFPCPHDDDIAPCVCDFVDDRLYLDCSNVTSEAELENVFLKEFPIPKFYEFFIRSNKYLNELTMPTNGVFFERMIFYPGSFKLNKISEDFLEDSFDSLRDFMAMNAPFTTEGVPFGYLNTMPNLHQLFVEASEITTVPTFNSSSIRDLRLALGNITELQPGIFDSPNFLFNLYLQFNRIERLQVNVFPIHLETARIRVDHNLISKIDRRSFYDASNNGSAGLTALYLNDNKITQLEIESIPLTRTSRIIHLENNEIAGIASPASFYFLSEPKLHTIQLFLGNNKLTVLQENKWIPIMEYLSVLDLKNNPLECGCDIAWIVLNSAYMQKISSKTTCYDGRLFSELDPQVYLELCGAQ